MPHSTLKLVGGVNQNETQALNENSGIFSSNLIRFFYDPNGISLVQKLGGWQKFFATAFNSIVRALWAWEDLNAMAHLAVGTQTNAATGYAELAVITNSTIDNVTPQTAEDDIAPVVSSISGDPAITITDSTITGITNYNTVYIATQIAIGGVVLYGLYACDPDGFLGATAYSVYARDILGNILLPTSTSSTPVLPSFTTTAGSSTVVVNLPGYTYQLGDSFPVICPTVVGGITFYGNYVVQSLIDVNDFTIITAQPAISSAKGFLNNGLARYIYNFGTGALPAGTGWGSGVWGGGGWGTGTVVLPSVGTPIDAVDWTFANWGEVLIACADRVLATNGTPFQPIYQWSESATQATIITNAPPFNDGVLVAMPQRQIVAWGSTQTGIPDPLLINWCDVGNYNQWIALVTNQAGSYRIPKGSKIVGAVQGPQQGLIGTDISVWSMQYIGPPYVYSFNEVGTGCGWISRKCCAAVNGIYFWMGVNQFYFLGADGVQTLPCSVWDVVYQNLNNDIDPVTEVPYVQKIRVAVNSLFTEIQWFYPSLAGGGEVDSYVKFNIGLSLWDYGSLARSAWIDQSVLGPPIGADPDTLYVYQHETSNDADTVPMLPSITTGYFTIAEGDQKTFIDWIWPDMKWGKYNQAQGATVQISFLVADYPGDAPQTFGPYSVTQATEYFYTRLRGRLIAVKISSSDLGSFWRIGAIRYRGAPDGKI